MHRNWQILLKPSCDKPSFGKSFPYDSTCVSKRLHSGVSNIQGTLSPRIFFHLRRIILHRCRVNLVSYDTRDGFARVVKLRLLLLLGKTGVRDGLLQM